MKKKPEKNYCGHVLSDTVMLAVRKLASFSPWFKAEIYFLAPSKNEGARSYYNEYSSN